MADSMKFSRIAKPISLGTSCWTCTAPSHREGFVQFDAGVIGGTVNTPPGCIPGYGKLTLCVGCVHELGRVAGMLDPEQAAQAHSISDELSQAVAKLHAQLETEKLNKFVPLADVVDFFEERAKRRPDEPLPVTEPKKAS